MKEQKIRQKSNDKLRLKELREKAGLTQEQVAIKMQLRGFSKITRSVYSQMECGTYNVRVCELIALKQIFNCKYIDFFE